MAFTISNQGNVGLLTLKGKFLGSIDGPEVKAGVQQLKEEGQTKLVVDLSKTDFMDSSGIGVLISALKTMREAGGDVVLAGMEKRIKNIFLMTKLLVNVFENYDNAEDAAASLA